MDMCSGPLFIKMLKFSIPLMLTGTLQLLYHAVDIIVVGNFAGKESLSAVGTTGPLVNLIVGVFMGLAIGTSVLMSNFYGSRDYSGMQKTIHTSVAISAIIGVGLTFIGFFLSPIILELMNTPEDVIDKSVIYLRIFFLGMPFNMVYNFSAAILRAVGDSKRPLYFLAISGILNVILNLIFVTVFKMDVAGVAVATVMSQVLSCMLVIRCLIKADGALKLNIKALSIDKKVLAQIIKIGVPAGIQGSLFSVSNVLIQSTINSFGTVVVAANAASGSLEGFLFVAMNAVYQTNINFTSQNLGAKKYKRIRACLWYGFALVTVIGVVLGFIISAFSEQLISLYNNDPEVVVIGAERLVFFASVYFLCGFMEVLTGQLRGLKCSLPPMFITLIGVCALRVTWVFVVFPFYPTLICVYASYPVTWVITSICLFITYLLVMKKLPKTDE